MGPRSFKGGHGDLHLRLIATLTALNRNRAARNRHQAARARHDMRTWQVERRKRTRHLIELGGLVVKAGIVDLTGDDRAMIYGALLWMADKLKSEQGERARALWTKLGQAGLRWNDRANRISRGRIGRDRWRRRGDLTYRSAAAIARQRHAKTVSIKALCRRGSLCDLAIIARGRGEY